MEFKESEKKYWDSHYSSRPAEYREGRDLPFHDAFKSVLKNLPADSKVLELACGLRCDGIEIAQAGKFVYETDISEVAVEKAKAVYNSLGLVANAEFIQVDAEFLPFGDNFFDAVFIAASFHHLPDPQRALKEMTRVTKSGGYVILGLEPNSWPYFTLFLIMRPLKWLIRKIQHKTFSSVADDSTHGFTKIQLKALAAGADFSVVSIGRFLYLGELYTSGLRLFSKLFGWNSAPDWATQKYLSEIDSLVAKIPIINLLNWHWSLIARKK